MPSISLQEEISAMVKQKCLYIGLLHRNFDIFYFSATKKQCNGELRVNENCIQHTYICEN